MEQCQTLYEMGKEQLSNMNMKERTQNTTSTTKGHDTTRQKTLTLNPNVKPHKSLRQKKQNQPVREEEYGERSELCEVLKGCEHGLSAGVGRFEWVKFD
ncbi:unnamed protein product [Sphenostylis stenocarpa]|uniref:Uncharacterized protein n=1 Tax=Sphenostylis stenocarpa TaxID=92480 RepID=A0AA86VGF5_9FABA|nr:unnamed protein product [Sphenostylis stenocarpa]